MLDKIIKRMREDPEERFTGKYFEDRVSDLRSLQRDLDYCTCCAYLACLRAMKFITDMEEIKATNELGDIFCGREGTCERILS